MPRIRRHHGTLIALAAVGVLAAGCAVPVPAFSSPATVQSAWSNPFGGPQIATVPFCSPEGGPVHIEIDVAQPTVITMLTVSVTGGDLSFSDDPDEATVSVRGDDEHHEFTTSNSLPPGGCTSISAWTEQFGDSDPYSARPFSMTVSW
jgi:hypothetical protein